VGTKGKEKKEKGNNVVGNTTHVRNAERKAMTAPQDERSQEPKPISDNEPKEQAIRHPARRQSGTRRGGREVPLSVGYEDGVSGCVVVVC